LRAAQGPGAEYSEYGGGARGGGPNERERERAAAQRRRHAAPPPPPAHMAGRPAAGGGADGGFQTLGRARGPRGPRPVAGAAAPAPGAAGRGGPVTFASVAHAAAPQATAGAPAAQAPAAAPPDAPHGQGAPEREPAEPQRQAPGQAPGAEAGGRGALQGFLTDAVQCAVPEPRHGAAPAPRAEPGRPAAQAGGGAPADASGWGAADDQAVAPAAGRAGPDGASAQQVLPGVGSASALALHVAQDAACLLRDAPGWLGGAAGEALQGGKQLLCLQAGVARDAVGLEARASCWRWVGLHLHRGRLWESVSEAGGSRESTRVAHCAAFLNHAAAGGQGCLLGLCDEDVGCKRGPRR